MTKILYVSIMNLNQNNGNMLKSVCNHKLDMLLVAPII